MEPRAAGTYKPWKQGRGYPEVSGAPLCWKLYLWREVPGQRIPRSPNQKLSQLESVISRIIFLAPPENQPENSHGWDPPSVTEASVDMGGHSRGHTPVQMGSSQLLQEALLKSQNPLSPLPDKVNVGTSASGCLAKFILSQPKPLIGWEELYEVSVLQ